MPALKMLLSKLGASWLALGLIAPPAAAGERYALLVAGIGGDAEYTKRHWEYLASMHRVLVEKLKFSPQNIEVLFEDPAIDPLVKAKATRLELEASLGRFARKIGPEDLFFLFAVGHGSYDGEIGKLNLVGPDATERELAAWLAKVRARATIVVNGASASGAFLKSLSGPNRIVITATRSGLERQDTIFPRFFIEALQGQGDIDKDGVVSLLEAFKYAEESVRAWYSGQSRVQTEHPQLDDDGDGKASREPGGDGAVAASLHLGPAEAAAAQSPDPTLAKLQAERQRLEGEILRLKMQRSRLSDSDYQKQLEELLVALARTEREIRKREKR